MQTEAADIVAEDTPLLAQNEPEADLDPLGVKYLLIQHFSSAWGDRTAEFALYLYLIAFYKDTLLPSSIFGFSMTRILFSSWAGSLVDKMHKLSVVRWSIFVQKMSALSAYSYRGTANDGRPLFLPSLCLFLLILSGCAFNFRISISIAVERDWTGLQSLRDRRANSERRTPTSGRSTSSATACASVRVVPHVKYDSRDDKPSFSIAVLAGISALTMVFELYWIQIVYHRFPTLAAEQLRKDNERRAPPRPICGRGPARLPAPQRLSSVSLSLKDWREFVRLPVFFSSVSISLLYLTVLSFEGTMLGYLKTLHFRDDFLAEMRGLCVITGLIGTVLTVPLENKLGSARAGSWSIWSMVVCLLPVLASFYIFGPRTTLGAVLLFGGMALSRIGLWSFDLIQTKQLQDALAMHARRNKLTALQFSMQSGADLLKYVLTMILSRPADFRWAGLVSFHERLLGRDGVLGLPEEGARDIFASAMEWIRKIL
ncbi:Ferroporti-1 [Mycena leptocephala]|nr:Ferroporti-1 [Mycena leptocephala]